MYIIHINWQPNIKIRNMTKWLSDMNVKHKPVIKTKSGWDFNIYVFDDAVAFKLRWGGKISTLDDNITIAMK